MDSSGGAFNGSQFNVDNEVIGGPHGEGNHNGGCVNGDSDDSGGGSALAEVVLSAEAYTTFVAVVPTGAALALVYTSSV